MREKILGFVPCVEMCEQRILDGPPWFKTVGVFDLLGTTYAPVSKIPSVKLCLDLVISYLKYKTNSCQFTWCNVFQIFHNIGSVWNKIAISRLQEGKSWSRAMVGTSFCCGHNILIGIGPVLIRSGGPVIFLIWFLKIRPCYLAKILCFMMCYVINIE